MANGKPLDQKVLSDFCDKTWRLFNLYWIVDEAGKKVKFIPNDVQAEFLREMWYLNLILKARQLGWTTLIDIWMLDECLFYDNQAAGIIANTLDNAKKIFRTKIQFPYDNLPEQLKQAIPSDNESAQELVFANGSSIWVGTSARSTTLQYLHISEMGKICATQPEKAREIRTGAFPAIHDGGYIFVESTAEGKEGDFYDMCRQYRALGETKKILTRKDFKFHFSPWWIRKEYRLSDAETEETVIVDRLKIYFENLKKKWGIDLDANQKAWYAKTEALQGEDMKREYPSTPDEPFEVSVEGAYFAAQMAKARADGRIGKFPIAGGIAVDTWWDIGVRDKTAIWFSQSIEGRVRFVHYYESAEEGLPHYVKYIHDWRDAKDTLMGKSTGPHDVKVREWGTGVSRQKQGRSLGIKFINAPKLDFDVQIEAARAIFSICEFDEEGCDVGLTCLDNYRKEWNETLGVWSDKERGDWASHGGAAFRTFAVMYRRVRFGNTQALPVEQAPYQYT